MRKVKKVMNTDYSTKAQKSIARQFFAVGLCSSIIYKKRNMYFGRERPQYYQLTYKTFQ